MNIVSIVYFTGGGGTGQMADAVAKGLGMQADISVNLIRIEGRHIHEGRWEHADTLAALTDSDLIVFGSPTYMGGPAAQFKAFADATGYLWRQRAWAGKLAAGFTISGNPSGDKLNTLSYLSILAAQQGMIWLNWNELPRQPDGVNHLGSSIGLMGQNPAMPGAPAELSAQDAVSAVRFGQYLGGLMRRLAPGDRAVG